VDALVWGAGIFLAGVAIGTLVGVMLHSRQHTHARREQHNRASATWLSRLDERFSSTRLHLRVNLWGVGIWLVLLPPTILFWQESVPYVVFMSWYANFVGHISAYIAAKAEETVENGNGGHVASP
jgi:hypothetical protein